MKILIYGATESGYMAARHLSNDHDVTVLDEQERLPDRFGNLDISFISGSAGDVSILQNADAAHVDLFVACTGLDEANIIACWTIKRIADIETICFVQRMELYKNLIFCMQSNYRTPYDIDAIIWPEQLLTQDIFRVISVPEAIGVEYFAKGRTKLFEYRIKENSSIRDKRVMDCDFPANVLIVGVTRDNKLSIPDGSTIIELNDKVVFMGTGSALDLLTARFFQKSSKISNAVVIGGGNVGFLLSEKLERTGIKVTVIERDRTRCAFLADNLNKSLVLCGDGTDIELLEGEAVTDTDVTICVTDNDEKNLLCSLLVKQISSCRIITRVRNFQTEQLFDQVGIDVVISPREAALRELLNHVQTRNTDVLALVEGGQGEVVRVMIPDGFQETRIAELTFQARGVIGVVQRGRQIIIPNGDTVIRKDDLLQIFTMSVDAEAIKNMFAI